MEDEDGARLVLYKVVLSRDASKQDAMLGQETSVVKNRSFLTNGRATLRDSM